MQQRRMYLRMPLASSTSASICRAGICKSVAGWFGHRAAGRRQTTGTLGRGLGGSKAVPAVQPGEVWGKAGPVQGSTLKAACVTQHTYSF